MFTDVKTLRVSMVRSKAKAVKGSPLGRASAEGTSSYRGRLLQNTSRPGDYSGAAAPA